MFKFDFSSFRGDFFGGITAGIVALPLALAFGAQTPMGAIAGLYGAIAIGILSAVFGGTPTQISGPTAPMTVVSLSVITSAIVAFGAESVTEALPFILATFFLAGLLELLLGVFRLGTYIRFIPYPVVSGFMSGIGVIIIITQIFPLLGYSPKSDAALVEQQLPRAEEVILAGILKEEEQEGILSGVMSKADLEETTRRAQQVSPEEIREEAARQASRKASGTVGTLKHITRPFSIPNGINWPSLILGLGTIILVYVFKRITTAVPSTLVALIVMTLVGYFAFAGQAPVIGQVPEGLPPIHLDLFPAFLDMGPQFTLVIEFALTLAFLGAIDSLLTSVVADNLTRTKHKSNRELIGQGIGNMGAALIGGLPGAGATMRTVININSGGSTRLSGLLAGLLLLAILLGLGPVVAYIPNGVLAGILVTVGISIIDYKAFKHLRSVPRTDMAVMFVVLFITVFGNLLLAVAIGMVMAALLFMKSISDVITHKTTSAPLQDFAPEIPWTDDEKFLEAFGDEVYIKHLDGPLFFGFAARFGEMVKALPQVQVIVLRMERVPYIDQSGLYALEEATKDLQEAGVKVVFSGLHGQPEEMVRRINLIPGLVPEEQHFKSFGQCRGWLQRVLKEAPVQQTQEKPNNNG